MKKQSDRDHGAGRDDPHDLERFVRAQEGSYRNAVAELRDGKKRSHWMWYVFPQIEGLGRSAVAQRYAIKSLDEARCYLGHPVLGPRLVECVAATLAVEGRTASEIFGYPDDLKFHSSLTLFARVAGPDSIFPRALRKYFAGEADSATLRILGDRGPGR